MKKEKSIGNKDHQEAEDSYNENADDQTKEYTHNQNRGRKTKPINVSIVTDR